MHALCCCCYWFPGSLLRRRVVRCYCDASSGHCGVDFERGGQRRRPVVKMFFVVVGLLILCSLTASLFVVVVVGVFRFASNLFCVISLICHCKRMSAPKENGGGRALSTSVCSCTHSSHTHPHRCTRHNTHDALVLCCSCFLFSFRPFSPTFHFTFTSRKHTTEEK